MSENVTSNDRQIILNNFKSVLEATPVVEGKNKVIIAHGFPEGVGLGEIPYMGTVIIKPKGEGNGYEVVHRLSLEDWSHFVS